MAGTLRLRFVFSNKTIEIKMNFFSSEHLQEVISLLSNEPKPSSSSLPLNESKEEDEQDHEQEETTFPDTVKTKTSFSSSSC